MKTSYNCHENLKILYHCHHNKYLFAKNISNANSELTRTYKKEFFAKMVTSFQSLTIF